MLSPCGANQDTFYQLVPLVWYYTVAVMWWHVYDLFTNRCSDASLQDNPYYSKYLDVVNNIPSNGKTSCITGSEHCLDYRGYSWEQLRPLYLWLWSCSTNFHDTCCVTKTWFCWMVMWNIISFNCNKQDACVTPYRCALGRCMRRCCVICCENMICFTHIL